MSIGLKEKGPPNQTPVAVRYRAIQPCQAWVRDKAGWMTLIGYGIGDVIETTELPVQFLVCSQERKDEIQLSDGTAIVKWDEQFESSMRRTT